MKKFAKWFGGGSKPEPAIATPIDLTGPAFIADPYPAYAALRDQVPVTEVASGGYLLTRHADVAAAFTDDRLGNAPSRFSVLAPKNRDKYAAADVAAQIPPFLDMPAHKLPRQALTRAFFDTFKPFEAAVRDEAERVLEARPSGAFDLIAEVSSPFALGVMARFVGVEADLPRLKAATQAFFHLFAPVTDAAQFRATNEALTEARAMIEEAVERGKSEPRGLIGALLAFQKDAPDLTDSLIIDNALLVLADGVENIEAGAASILATLSQSPETIEALRTGTLGYEAAVREALRLQTPGQIVPRICRSSFELHGIQIAEGTPVFLALASANRDPEAFDRPDAFVPDRSESSVTFGLGRHRCIGELLGLMQLRVLTQALVTAGICTETNAAPMRYQPRFGHRWPVALRVSG